MITINFAVLMLFYWLHSILFFCKVCITRASVRKKYITSVSFILPSLKAEKFILLEVVSANLYKSIIWGYNSLTDFHNFSCSFDFYKGIDHFILWQFLNCLNNVSLSTLEISLPLRKQRNFKNFIYHLWASVHSSSFKDEGYRPTWGPLIARLLAYIV